MCVSLWGQWGYSPVQSFRGSQGRSQRRERGRAEGPGQETLPQLPKALVNSWNSELLALWCFLWKPGRLMIHVWADSAYSAAAGDPKTREEEVGGPQDLLLPLTACTVSRAPG